MNFITCQKCIENIFADFTKFCLQATFFELQTSTIAQKTHNRIVYKVFYSDNHNSMPMYGLRCHKPQKSEKCPKISIFENWDFWRIEISMCENVIFWGLLFSQANMDSLWQPNRFIGNLAKINVKLDEN